MASPTSAQRLLLLTATVAVLFVASGYSILSPPTFYPYGSSQDSIVPTADDSYTSPITLNPPFPYYCAPRSTLFVGTNGLISFGSGISSYVPSIFPATGLTMIAPYWSDIDTRLNNGKIYYRNIVRQTIGNADPTGLLAQASADVHRYFATAQYAQFTAQRVFITTWFNVTHYGGSDSTPVNSIQSVLITDGTMSFAMFNYGELTWTVGTASNVPAEAGFNSGTGSSYYTLPGSRTAFVTNLNQASNVYVPGRWIFRIDGCDIVHPNPACISTGSSCLTASKFACVGRGIGDYQACEGCTFYHSCAAGGVFWGYRPCPRTTQPGLYGYLVWQTTGIGSGYCDYSSTTCNEATCIRA